MKLSKYIACICEGAAEQAIIECLLDANKLIFTYDDMIEGEVIRYKKSNKKPSEFCKTELKYKNVKSTEFLKEYFADASVLVSAIIEYKRVSNIRNGECTLADLLR